MRPTKKELKDLDAWKEQEDKLCYRKFLLIPVSLTTVVSSEKKKVEAKSVWLTARDFLRVKKSNEARTALVSPKKSSAKEWVARQEAIIKNPRAAKKVSEDADSDIDLSGVQTVDSKVERPLPDRKSSGHAPTAKPRIITPEEQQANEHAFAQREQQRQERIEEREAKSAVASVYG